MKTLILGIFSIVAIVGGAQEPDQTKSSDRIALAGGVLIKKGTFTGKVAVVNSQTKLSQSDIDQVVSRFSELTGCNFVTAENGDDAAVVLTVIDDPKAPTILIATEEHWGRVNVSKLTDDLPGEKAKKKFFAPRARKMIIKAMSLLCGGGASQFPGNIMNTVTARELDVVQEGIPLDMVGHYQRYLRALGVTPKEESTYRAACRDGWAPAPTNDIQRAIWDKVHAMPTEPIKIKPEAAKQK